MALVQNAENPGEAKRRTEEQRIQVGQEERESRYSSERAPERGVNEGQVPEKDISHTEDTTFAKAYWQETLEVWTVAAKGACGEVPTRKV